MEPTRSLVGTICLSINGLLIEHISGMERGIGRLAKKNKYETP
jgi:hypothetical protein